MLPRTPLFLAGVLSQALRLDTRQEDDVSLFRVRDKQSMVVLGDYLYIEGGRISNYYSNGTRISDDELVAINDTKVISLASSWKNTTVDIGSIPRDEDFPRAVSLPALWVDEDRNVIYRWGGSEVNDESIPASYQTEEEVPMLWQLHTNGQGGGFWSTAGSPPNTTLSPGPFMASSDGAWATCGGAGFMVGGTVDESTDARSFLFNYPDNHMLSFHLNLMVEERWEVLFTWSLVRLRRLTGASGVCLPDMVSSSLLFVLGGETSESGSRNERVLRDIGNVTFYDRAARTWHWQSTTGLHPESVKSFCATGLKGHNGTYEIFVYGGSDSLGRAVDSVHILTIPGFHWFRANAPGNYRHSHACATLPGGQIAVSGGLVGKGPGEILNWTNFNHEDVWQNSLGIFDMASMSWSDGYDADRGRYETPQVIQDWYRDNGMNTVDWDTEDVERLFTSDGDDSDADVSTGAIAGGVAGGIVGLALFCGLGYYVVRRRRKRRDADGGQPSEGAQSKTDDKKSENHAELDPDAGLAELDHTSRPSELGSSNGQSERAPTAYPPTMPVELPAHANHRAET